MVLHLEVVGRLVSGLRQPPPDPVAGLGIATVEECPQCLGGAHGNQVTQL
jgi:hypothetical protein